MFYTVIDVGKRAGAGDVDRLGFRLCLVTCFSLAEMLVPDRDEHGP